MILKEYLKFIGQIFTASLFLLASVLLINACNTGAESKETIVDVTYTNRVANILNTHCAKCHNPKGAGPFPLLDYRQAARKSKTIAKVTRKGYMPPWPADRSYTTFLHEPTITKEEVEALQKWAEAGAPFGDSSELREPPTVNPYFIARKPDTSIGVISRLSIRGDNRDRFFALKIPIELDGERYLRAIELCPITVSWSINEWSFSKFQP